ncbi:TPA_asm: hypothetical protein GZX72_14250 [Listeria monocytogenes]|nr:hypothetical protein [Listeria monocytogenes]
MEFNESQSTKLSEKIEETIQSTDFGIQLGVYDAHLYEQMLREAFEQQDMPDDIEPKDVDCELLLTSTQSPDAWVDILGREEIHNEAELKKVMENKEELVQAMLLHMEGNFKAEVEIREELDEIRERFPDIEKLASKLDDWYDDNLFIEWLEENDPDELHEQVREVASDEGVPEELEIKDIPYEVYVSLTSSFEALAEVYLEEAREYGDVTMYASENVFNIIDNEDAYEIEVSIDTDQAKEIASQ